MDKILESIGVDEDLPALIKKMSDERIEDIMRMSPSDACRVLGGYDQAIFSFTAGYLRGMRNKKKAERAEAAGSKAEVRKLAAQIADIKKQFKTFKEHDIKDLIDDIDKLDKRIDTIVRVTK